MIVARSHPNTLTSRCCTSVWSPPSKNPAAAVRVRAAILETLQMLLLFPHAGRRQTVEGVRKIVTRHYAYIVYYSVDLDLQEIVVNSIQHPAREREYRDV